MINGTEKAAVVKAAREWAKAERRLREIAWYPNATEDEKKWASDESDRTEAGLLTAVKDLEKAEAREAPAPWWRGLPSSPYGFSPGMYDLRMQEITKEYIEKLYELSIKLEGIHAPPAGQIVAVHAPFHTIEFHPHRAPKCKECGK